MLITGIGGTGVVTIGAIMGMAAHLEGKGATVLDQLGMAQKGGAVISHVRIGATPEALHAVRLGAGGANLLLGCDLVVSAGADALARLEPGVSRAIVNTHETITGEFTRHPDLAFPAHTLKLSIEAAAGADACDFLDATGIATALMGNSIATNMFMLGYAYQKGLMPIGHEALEQAIELNGAAVADEHRGLPLGPPRRRTTAPRSRSSRRRPPTAVVPFTRIAKTLDEIVAVAHQAPHRLPERGPGRALQGAGRQGARGRAEGHARPQRPRRGRRAQLRQAARLQGRVRGGAALRRCRLPAPSSRGQFEGDYKLKFHLAPPLFSSRDPKTGHLIKQEFGAWMLPAFRMLAKLKGLRGTGLRHLRLHRRSARPSAR